MKISNFTIFFVTTCLLIIVIITATTISITDSHDERLMHAMESKVEYYAKRCYLENNCSGVIMLKDLYDKEYLSEIINPVTKEIIDYNTTIEYKNDIIIINW